MQAYCESTHLVSEANTKAKENASDNEHGQVLGAGAEASADKEANTSDKHCEFTSHLARHPASDKRCRHTYK